MKEEITVIRDIPISYVKVGPNVAAIMTQNKKIEFAIMEKRIHMPTTSKKVEAANSAADNEHQSKIDELQDRLYHDLMDIARSVADERNATIQQVINMEALRQMSIIMPQTEEEMFQIQHITKANFEKYGARFLQAIIPYSAQRSVYEMDHAEQMMENDDGDEDGVDYSQDWEALGREASSSGSASKGFKRRSNSSWSKNIAKKYKRSRSGGKKKGKSPAKKRASATARKTQKAMMPAPRPTF